MSQLPFNTDDDLYVIISYIRSQLGNRGKHHLIIVEMDELVLELKEKCKILTEIALLSLGIPINNGET